jgi:ribosome-binding factor A
MSDRRRPPDPSGGAKESRASQRQLRVGEELRHVLAQLLRDGACRDPGLRDADITVTEVRLSPDLRNATAFVMPLGGRNATEIVAGLERSAGFLRGLVSRAMQLRRVPVLAFTLDPSFDEAGRIAELLARPDVRRDLDPAPPAAPDHAG